VPWVFKDLPVSRDTYWNRLSGYRRNAESDRPSIDSFRYATDAGAYLSYNKTALWLHTLERLIGWPVLQRALAAYFDRHAFGHPAPDDFFRIVSEVSGRDLTWFFDEVHNSSNVFDYGVEALQSEQLTAGYRTTVLVRRYGEAVFPVAVRVTFEDGGTAVEQWDGRERWQRYTYDRPVRARSVEVDPERVLLLDVNYTNNSRTLRPRGGEAATKWTLAWMVWLQDALALWSFWL
jgi:aminopeptidase N